MYNSRNAMFLVATVIVSFLAYSNYSQAKMDLLSLSPWGVHISLWFITGAAVAFVASLGMTLADKTTVFLLSGLILSALVYLYSEAKTDGDLSTNEAFNLMDTKAWILVALGTASYFFVNHADPNEEFDKQTEGGSVSKKNFSSK